jgi:hypothetical protein
MNYEKKETPAKPRRDVEYRAAKCNSAPEMTRTSDLRFRKPLLYPLSYRGWFLARKKTAGGRSLIKSIFN